MLEGENDGYIFNDNFSLFLIYLLLVAIFVLFERIILCKALKNQITETNHTLKSVYNDHP